VFYDDRYDRPVREWGTTAIGWQVATEDWGTVQAYVICAS
jgi:hypothetical protein